MGKLGADFHWFFAARVVSLAGSAMTPVALAFAVLAAPGGRDLLGVVLAAQMVPLIVFVVVGGGVADRYRRDVVLRVANLAAGLSQAATAVVVLTGRPVGWLVPLSFLTGVSAAFTMPALRGIVPQLVPPGEVRRVNSMLSSSNSALRVLGPSAAGVFVVVFGGGWALALDALSFLLAAALMLKVRVPARPASGARMVDELREGWSYFWSVSWVWPTTLAFLVVNLVIAGAWQVLGPVIASETFGASAWGVVLSVRAGGTLVFSLVMLKLDLRRPLVVALCAVSLTGVSLVLLGTHAALPWLVVGGFVAGAGYGLSGVVWETALQTGIPEDKLSRVASYDNLGSFVAMPLGQLAVLPLAGAMGTGEVAIASGIVFTAAALSPLLAPAVRHFGRVASVAGGGGGG